MNKKTLIIIAAVAVCALTVGVSVYANEKKNTDDKISSVSNSDGKQWSEDDVLKYLDEELSKEPVEVQVHKDGIIQSLQVNSELTIQIKEVTASTLYNYESVAKSKDGKVASIRRNDETKKFGWIITNGNDVASVDLSSYGFTSVLDSRWLDDDTVQAVCHINPSTSYCFTYNLKTGFEMNFGADFCRDRNNLLYFVETKPHFASYDCPSWICNSKGERLYETEMNVCIDCLTVTDNYFIFYERGLYDEDALKLVVLSRESLKTVYEYDKPAYGQLVAVIDPNGKPSVVEPTEAPVIKVDVYDENWWIDVKGDKTRLVDSSTYSKLYSTLLRSEGGITALLKSEDFDKVQRFAFATSNSFLCNKPEDMDSFAEGMHVRPVYVGEGMLVFEDSDNGEWCYVRTMYSEGWVKKTDIGFVDREVFKKHESCREENVSMILKAHRSGPVTFYGSVSSDGGAEENTVVYDGYIFMGSEFDGNSGYFIFAQMPIRLEDGTACFVKASTSKDVISSSRIFNTREFYKTVFSLGQQEIKLDCISSVRAVYASFAIRLPMELDNIMNIPGVPVSFADADNDKKAAMLLDMPVATILDFSGHLMLLLGEVDGVSYAFEPETAQVVMLDATAECMEKLTRAVYLKGD